MGQFKYLWKSENPAVIDFLRVARVTATSALTGHPASNVLDYTHPYRSWKTATPVATTDAIVLDMGSGFIDMGALVIDRCNCGQVQIQNNATDSWGSPTYSQQWTMARDYNDGRWKLCAEFDPPLSGRYIRIKANLTGTVDGQTVWEVGTILPLIGLGEFVTNPGVPYEMDPLQVASRLPDGGSSPEVAAIGNRYCEIRITQPMIPADDVGAYRDIAEAGEHLPIVLYRNAGSLGEVYICRRRGRSPIAKLGPNHYGLTSMVFEECH